MTDEMEWWEGEGFYIDTLPVKHPLGHVCTQVRSFCPDCKQEGETVVRHVSIHAECIEVKECVACWSCRIRFITRVRMYPAHWTAQRNEGWVSAPFARSWLARLRKLWRRAFER